jgi:hypothetical protein
VVCSIPFNISMISFAVIAVAPFIPLILHNKTCISRHVLVGILEANIFLEKIQSFI